MSDLAELRSHHEATRVMAMGDVIGCSCPICERAAAEIEQLTKLLHRASIILAHSRENSTAAGSMVDEIRAYGRSALEQKP